MRNSHNILVPRAILSLLFAATIWAQPCTISSTVNCPSTGIYAGPPPLPEFLNGAYASFSALSTYTQDVPGPGTPVTLSAQLTGLSATFISSDPRTCPNSGTCVFNNLANEEAYIRSMLNPYPAGVGLKSVDINIWMGPFMEASQYPAACAAYGACGTPGYPNWYANSLAVYDAVIPYIQSFGAQVRLAPIPTTDVIAACGISRGTGNFTEAQVEDCMKPLEVVMVERYHIDFISVVHEICGAMALDFNTSGCALSASDGVKLATNLALAVRAHSSNSAIKIGVGSALADDSGDTPVHNCGNPGSTSQWCAWINSSSFQSAINYMSVHVYPLENGQPGESSGYWNGNATGTLENYTAMLQQIPAGKIRNADESSGLRWGNGSGDAGTILGCGSLEWLDDGSFEMWAQTVAGEWAESQGLGEFSLFPTEGLVYLTSDLNNNRCATNTDDYEPLVYTTYAGQVSEEGLIYGQVASQISLYSAATKRGVKIPKISIPVR